MSASLTIAEKDLKEVFNSVSIYGPMIGVPVFFAIILPILTFYVAEYAAPSIASKLINIPQGAISQGSLRSIGFMLFFSINVLGPVFLTMPIITASVIAADSFAGEKERKTSEALLSMPIKTRDLMLGKILSSLIPATLITLLVFATSGLITDYFSHKFFGVNILPNLEWILMLLTSPFLALATIGLVVIVSSHVKGVKEAQQISTLLILPILIMPFASIFGFARLSVEFFAYVIGALGILDLVIITLAINKFKKENIL
ncbi:MAG: ABC transporter permease subunit [Candidatus Micrarchaeaceae archaeon]